MNREGATEAVTGREWCRLRRLVATLVVSPQRGEAVGACIGSRLLLSMFISQPAGKFTEEFPPMKNLVTIISAFILSAIFTACESGPYVYGKRLSFWIHQLDSPNSEIRKEALDKLRHADPDDLSKYKDRIRELAKSDTSTCIIAAGILYQHFSETTFYPIGLYIGDIGEKPAAYIGAREKAVQDRDLILNVLRQKLITGILSEDTEYGRVYNFKFREAARRLMTELGETPPTKEADTSKPSDIPTPAQAAMFFDVYVPIKSKGNLKYVSCSKTDGKLNSQSSYEMYLNIDCVAQTNCTVSRNFETCGLDSNFMEGPSSKVGFNSHVKRDLVLIFEKRESGWLGVAVK